MPPPLKSVLALLVLASSLLAAPPPGATAADPYIPNDAEAVLFLHVRKALDSPLVRKRFAAEAKELVLKAPGSDFLTALGVDPLKDVESITLAGPGRLASPPRGVAVVRGRFDAQAIDAAADGYAQKHPAALKIDKQDGRRIYEARLAGDKDVPPLFGCVLDKDVAVLSPSRTYVVEAIAKQAGKKKPVVSRTLQPLLSKADAAQTAWWVGVVSRELKQDLTKNPQLRGLALLQSFAGGAMLADDVSFRTRLQTANPRTAQELGQALENGRGLLGLLAQNNRDLQGIAGLVQGTKVSLARSAVVVEGTVGGDQMERVISGGKKR